jgi:hypothetical protein
LWHERWWYVSPLFSTWQSYKAMECMTSCYSLRERGPFTPDFVCRRHWQRWENNIKMYLQEQNVDWTHLAHSTTQCHFFFCEYSYQLLGSIKHEIFFC